MSDPYIAPSSISPASTASVSTGDDHMRRGTETRPPVPVSSGGGFATGLMVALVFVVLAILASVIYNNRGFYSPASGTPGVTTPDSAEPAASDAGATSGTAGQVTPAPPEGTVDPANE